MVYWDTYHHVSGFQFLVAATEKGLCFTGSDGQGMEELAAWVAKKRAGAEIERNAEQLAVYKEAFDTFFAGASKELHIPLDVVGTAFQLQVWEALKAIPFGETCSYGDIAQAIDHPRAVRAVGGAIGANPIMIVIPCHRVIGKNGTLTGFRGGLQLKEKLLHFEQGN